LIDVTKLPEYSEAVDSVIILFSSIMPSNVKSNIEHTQIYEQEMVGPREMHDTIGTFPGQSSVKLQRVRIDLQVPDPFETQPHNSYNKVYTKLHIAATCVPRGSPAPNAQCHHVNTQLYIYTSSPPRPRHARDRPQAPQPAS
jgi:hypothetical protein